MAYEKMIRTFVVDRKGVIHEAESNLTVQLTKEQSERISSGVEVALIQTPALPSLELLEAKLAAAENSSDEDVDVYALTPEEREVILVDRIVKLLTGIGRKEELIREIRSCIESTKRIKRDVEATLNRFTWKGKRYAPQPFAENLNIAEADSGFLMLKIVVVKDPVSGELKAKVSELMDPAHPGKPMRGPFTSLTIAGRLFPGIKLAQVQVPTNMTEEEKSVVRNAMKCILWNGRRYEEVLGTGGLKNGQIIFVEEKYSRAIARMYDMWPEAALAYGNMLVNECREAQITFEATVKVVKEGDLGTNDGSGFINKSIMDMLPALLHDRFLQVRAAITPHDLKLSFDKKAVLGKGCVQGMEDEVSCHPEVLADMIIPDSFIKPDAGDVIGKTFRATVHLGVTSYSTDGETYLAQTGVIHMPWEVIEKDVIPDSERILGELTNGFHSEGHQDLLKLIGAENSITGFYRVMEGCLAADGDGSFMRHPFVHSGTLRLMAAKLRKLFLGGVLMDKRTLKPDSFIAVDENGKLFHGTNWMPDRAALTDNEGNRSITIRFPIRMREDLLPVEHISSTVDHGKGTAVDYLLRSFPEMSRTLAVRIVKEQLYLKHCVSLNGGYAKLFGGDYDGDLVYLMSGVRYPNVIDWRFNMEERKQPKKNKVEKQRRPWHEIGRISFEAMGNTVGSVTNTILSVIAGGEWERQYPLAEELQNEVGGLKHGTRADMERVRLIKAGIPIETVDNYLAGNCKVALSVLKKEATPIRDPKWLAIDKKEVKSFTDLPDYVAPASDADVVAKLYNHLYAVAKELLGEAHPISYYAAIFDGLYGDNAITKEMQFECKLAKGLYGSQTGKVSAWTAKKREVMKAAKEELKQLRDSNNHDIEQAQALNEQIRILAAEYEKAQVESRKYFSFMRNIVCAWGNGKTAEMKMYWAAALNETLVPKTRKNASNGQPNQSEANKPKPTGTGSILFHAFPQQVVDAVAASSKGTSRPVDQWKENWHVEIDTQALTVTKVVPGGDGETRTVLFTGTSVEKKSAKGYKYKEVEWKRVLESLDLGLEFDDYEKAAANSSEEAVAA